MSSNLTTREEGYKGSSIEGFAEEDIEKEIKRVKNLVRLFVL